MGADRGDRQREPALALGRRHLDRGRPARAAHARDRPADGALWCAGLRIDPDRDPNGRAARAFLARRDEATWSPWITNELLFLGVDGVSFGPDGALWLGSREGVGVARHTAAGQWGQVAGLATADNDSAGLFVFGANILSLAAAPDGDVWVSQYDFHVPGQGGLLRLRPGAAADLTDVAGELLSPTDAPPGHHRTVRIVRHPDGPLMMCTDQLGVDVLVDPARPRDPAAWVRLPVDTDGLGGGVVRDAVVARRDVVWFTVNGIGLMRWDINGPAGPEAPLTWSDLADDVWTGPIAAVSGTSFNFAQARALAAPADGTLWAGGSGGVAHLRPLDGGGAVLLAAYGAKADVYLAGLLTGTVSDLELDDNGDLWVALEGDSTGSGSAGTKPPSTPGPTWKATMPMASAVSIRRACSPGCRAPSSTSWRPIPVPGGCSPAAITARW